MTPPNLARPLPSLAFLPKIMWLYMRPAFVGRLTPEQGKALLVSEGPNATAGLYVVRLSPGWKGFEVDFMEVVRAVLQVSTTVLTLRDDGRLTNGSPTFDNLNAFLSRYTKIYKQPYNRSFPRHPSFRWDLSLKEAHHVVAALPINAFIIRLSQTQAGNISISFNASPKPQHHLVTLSGATTYTCQNTTYTDFETMLASPNFQSLIPAPPAEYRCLGVVPVVLEYYFAGAEENKQIPDHRGGQSVELVRASEGNGNMYSMETDDPLAGRTAHSATAAALSALAATEASSGSDSLTFSSPSAHNQDVKRKMSIASFRFQ